MRQLKRFKGHKVFSSSAVTGKLRSVEKFLGMLNSPYMLQSTLTLFISTMSGFLSGGFDKLALFWSV